MTPSTPNPQQVWEPLQIKYADFVARGKTNRAGEKFSEEEFAKIIGVNRTTLWRWTQLPGWGELLLSSVQKELRPHLPGLSKMIVGKAAGKREFKDIDIPAANLAIKLMGVLVERQKIESIVDAKVEASMTFNKVEDAELDAIISGEKVAVT